MDYFLRFLAFAALTCSFKPLPALNAGDLEAAIDEYSHRKRRFGGV